MTPTEGTTPSARYSAKFISKQSFGVALSSLPKSECSVPHQWNARGLFSDKSSSNRFASIFSTARGPETNRSANDQMKERAKGFTAKVRNKLAHALNGNIVEYEVYTPTSSRVWERSVQLPTA